MVIDVIELFFIARVHQFGLYGQLIVCYQTVFYSETHLILILD